MRKQNYGVLGARSVRLRAEIIPAYLIRIMPTEG